MHPEKGIVSLDSFNLECNTILTGTDGQVMSILDYFLSWNRIWSIYASVFSLHLAILSTLQQVLQH